ncbi:MAG TPA: DUF948 domain-containing protein [Candidatus Kapabacteria bacterium]|jgi:uncharacterized protein YoxC|nr:DUF948 domain-containing protein [Candidatus Kapabacteria bacterium]
MEDVFQVVLYIAASLALLALAWLFTTLAKTVKGLGSVIENTNKIAEGLVGEVQGIRKSLQGTIENVEVITSRVPQTLDHVNGQLAQVDGILGSVRELADDLSGDVARLTTDATDLVHAAKGVVISLIDLEQDIQLKVQRPVVELMSVFSAVGKGIHAFRMKVSGNGDAHALNGTRRDRYDDLDDEYDDDLDFDGTAAPVIEPERAPAYRM